MLTRTTDWSGSTKLDIGEWTPGLHFRWISITRFINIATTMSGVVFNFDIFSDITTHVRLFDFLALELTVGISYLCMDSFIKQYTRRFDCNSNLNPLFRGISYGQFLQTGYFSLIHGSFIVDTIRFLVGAIKDVPSWTLCGPDDNETCVPMKNILLQCNKNKTTAFQNTSAFLYYLSAFTHSGKSTIMTSRLFLTAIVWIVTFLLTSVTADNIIKIYKISVMFRELTTVVTFTLLLFNLKNELMLAFSDVLGVTTQSSWASSMQHVTYTYGIGFLGIYDFGTISPYTMMDTASVIFMITFTFFAFMRSWIVRILYLGMIKCVVIDDSYPISTHSLLYAVLPLTTEFIHAKKFFVLYVYGNLTITLIAVETFLISTMSKFLHCEFQNVKQIYMIGIVCAFGFITSLVLTAIHPVNQNVFIMTSCYIILSSLAFIPVPCLTFALEPGSVITSLARRLNIGFSTEQLPSDLRNPKEKPHSKISTSYGIRHMIIWGWGVGEDISVLYLSGFRVAVIMWMYGLKRFAADIHFWLNFNPTRYWLITWSLLPIVLFGFMVNEARMLPQLTQSLQLKSIIWMAFTASVVLASQIKTIADYLLRNNIIGLFKANKSYGPPEPEDRRRRQFYHELSGHRKCRHNCIVLDEWFHCDHEQLVRVKSTTSAMSEKPSLLNIYKSEGKKPPRVAQEGAD